jgi:L,D-peptidoglycan transpeptidase YkuD (ErfK/YbiS/YcfS/YnhG family)|tara:strand:- start:392 stop:886 length:495 start_codon:yes stop_codon:yes gene_type:complete
MIIYLKNKHTLKIDDFTLRCCVGKNGISKKKREGDKKTPIGSFFIENLYYRPDRIKKPKTRLKCVKITRRMGWCDDPFNRKKYNKLINVKDNIKCERLYRRDDKYDLIIPIKYNFSKPIVFKGSCIFMHLTKNYKPTAGCIAMKKKDFIIMLKLINKKTKIRIN